MRLREVVGCLAWSVLILLAAIAGGVILLSLTDMGWLPEWVTIVVVSSVGSLGVVSIIAQYAERAAQRADADNELRPTLTHMLLAKRFARAEGISVMIAAITVGTLAFFVVPPIQRSLYYRSETDLFFIPVDPLAGTLPTAVFSAGAVSIYLWRRFAKQYGSEWRVAERLVSAPLSVPAVKSIAWLAMVVGALLTWLTVDCYTRVTQEGLYFNRFWSLRERFYPHEDIVGIAQIVRYKHAQTGAIKYHDDPYYGVRFRDGFEFATAHTAHRYDRTAHQLMLWLSQCTGVPLREVTQGVDW